MPIYANYKSADQVGSRQCRNRVRRHHAISFPLNNSAPQSRSASLHQYHSVRCKLPSRIRTFADVTGSVTWSCRDIPLDDRRIDIQPISAPALGKMRQATLLQLPSVSFSPLPITLTDSPPTTVPPPLVAIAAVVTALLTCSSPPHFCPLHIKPSSLVRSCNVRGRSGAFGPARRLSKDRRQELWDVQVSLCWTANTYGGVSGVGGKLRV